MLCDNIIIFCFCFFLRQEGDFGIDLLVNIVQGLSVVEVLVEGQFVLFLISCEISIEVFLEKAQFRIIILTRGQLIALDEVFSVYVKLDYVIEHFIIGLIREFRNVIL